MAWENPETNHEPGRSAGLRGWRAHNPTWPHPQAHSGGGYLGVDLSQRLPQLLGLASEYHGLRGAVRGRDLHRDAGPFQDLLQGVTLGPNDILVLGLLHLHRDGRGLLFLSKSTVGVSESRAQVGLVGTERCPPKGRVQDTGPRL